MSFTDTHPSLMSDRDKYVARKLVAYKQLCVQMHMANGAGYRLQGTDRLHRLAIDLISALNLGVKPPVRVAHAVHMVDLFEREAKRQQSEVAQPAH